jgi:hypothetical protein
MVFMGEFFYPTGGWNDFKDSFTTVEEAKDFIIERDEDYDWAHIVDKTTDKAVYKHRR